jgi:hypothetical protein
VRDTTSRVASVDGFANVVYRKRRLASWYVSFAEAR